MEAALGLGFPYKKDGRDLELRFKCFAVDGNERSVILCYHGLVRGEKSMDDEFKAFYAFVADGSPVGRF